MNWWAANTAMIEFTNRAPAERHTFAGFDVSEGRAPADKDHSLRVSTPSVVGQKEQLSNPGSRIVFDGTTRSQLLQQHGSSYQGIKTGDDDRVRRCFWEVATVTHGWRYFQSTVRDTRLFGGLHGLIDWRDAGASLARRQGTGAWTKRGVMVSQMRHLPVALYLGDLFDSNASPIIPHDERSLMAVWTFCSSAEYTASVRRIDQSLKPTNTSLVQVPFDLEYWQKAASEKCPNGLPKPHSNDPTQWLFSGDPKGSAAPLQVAAARLLGYAWPRQTGSEFPDCPALAPDGLERHAGEDGIVCLTPLRGDASAADRLRAFLVDSFGGEWSAKQQNELLAGAGSAGQSLDDWLRDGYFEQHCELFHQRPFVWHIWDGLSNGFGALINYHKLAAPDGEGRRMLEKLVFTYLGEWIDRQRADQKVGVEGADGRVAASEHLKHEIEKILEGEPPYDLFIRWKSLHQQPVGWEPDISDGVRVNIRPFMTAKPLNARGKNTCILRATPKIKWDKDRGKEPQRPKPDFPWFWTWDEQTPDFVGGKNFDGNRWNDLHYTRDVKLAARERAKHGGTVAV